MLASSRLMIDGTLFCLVFGIIVMGSLWWNARLWLNDYPEEMQAIVPPLNAAEKRTQKLMAMVLLVFMFGIPAWSLWQVRMASGGQLSFAAAFIHVWLLFNLANLFDAVVLDWIILTQHTPKFAILPGTEHLMYLLRDPRMHLRNYAKGIVIMTVFSLIFAFIASR